VSLPPASRFDLPDGETAFSHAQIIWPRPQTSQRGYKEHDVQRGPSDRIERGFDISRLSKGYYIGNFGAVDGGAGNKPPRLLVTDP
jgi:hypothetical protein